MHYRAQREARGSVGQHAAEWSDAAARSVHAALHAGSEAHGVAVGLFTERLLRGSTGDLERFVSRDCHGLCAADRAVALEIMGCNATRMSEATTREARTRRTRSFLKPLRERARARGVLGRLEVAPLVTPAGIATFHKWLSRVPGEDRHRQLLVGGRAQDGIATWPLDWLTAAGAVCYERAAGRLSAEFGGEPSEAAVRTLIRTDVLPTAVASAADHYLLVSPGGEVRYLTVVEVARSCGISETSPLMAALNAPEVMSEVQAVSCLGRGVHVGVARLIVRMLIGRGLITPGATYGSAYSGVDGVAAALEAELGETWSYRFASDRLAHVRAALLHAWSGRGLTPSRCHGAAHHGAATAEEAVDLWSLTPSCEPFSRRNRGRSREAQCACLAEVWASLSYARAAAPRVILVENVVEPEVSAPLTGLLQRLEGYVVESAVLDPRVALGEPVARERRFWVLTRTYGPRNHAAYSGGEASSSVAHDPMGAAH